MVLIGIASNRLVKEQDTTSWYPILLLVIGKGPIMSIAILSRGSLHYTVSWELLPLFLEAQTSQLSIFLTVVPVKPLFYPSICLLLP